MKEKFMEHLSKEIETTINNIYLFRTRSAFTVWIGPFIILGSVVIASKSKIGITTNGLVWSAIFFSGMAYLALGWVAGRIEKANWTRVDNLRSELVRLSQSEDAKIDINNFKDNKIVSVINKTYLAVFFAVGILFFCATIILAHLK